MSADERPAKRPRPDDAEPSPDSTPIVRSPDFWFDEGNIILQVESTQFRVMKSFLAMHSTVFRGMLLVPLPPYEPLVEGCPVVVLSGDTKEEWESMFAVMFPKMPDITHLAAVLRLSVKYDMAEFRKECCARLRVDFPATWKQFLKNREKTSWQCFTYEEDQCISQLIGPVREAGLYSTLPAMFYQLLLEILDQEGIIGAASHSSGPDSFPQGLPSAFVASRVASRGQMAGLSPISQLLGRREMFYYCRCAASHASGLFPSCFLAMAKGMGTGFL
ncbi:BTB domain-containing protein [Mycena kentingensis (nom. inval.)]|nr:BTB domain-containing protein [Mycena kentingensis (nom. inval.)]